MECFLCVVIAFAIPVGISLIFGIIKAITEGTRDAMIDIIDDAFDEWDKKSQNKKK